MGALGDGIPVFLGRCLVAGMWACAAVVPFVVVGVVIYLAVRWIV